MLSPRRNVYLILPREEFVVICRQLGKSWGEIGRFMHRHHTSALHYWRRAVKAGRAFA